MSNVFARFHEPTGLEYFDNATELYIELRRVLRTFPKRDLYTDVVPILKSWDRMRDNISKAQARFPNNEENLEARKEYIRLAIDNAKSLETKIQDAIWVVPSATPDQFEKVGIMLEKEIMLLKGWEKKSCIIHTKKKKQCNK